MSKSAGTKQAGLSGGVEAEHKGTGWETWPDV